MPRAIQAFKNQRQSPYLDRDKVLTDSKMPDSSAGDSPRSQPTKPVRAGYTPSSVRAARSLLFRTRTSSNGENDDDDTDIKPKTFVRPSPSTTPKSSKFSPKPGGLAEAAMEVTKTISPLQRSSKWLKAEHDTETKLPSSNKFYSSQKSSSSSPLGLSERDLNVKINNTSGLSSFSSPTKSNDLNVNINNIISSISSPKSNLDNEFKYITIDDNETDGESKKEDGNNEKTLEVTLPAKLEPHKIGLQNRGNTCYLNSTVQALLGLPMVVTDATNLKHAVQKMNISMENTKLVLPFASLCQAQSLGDVTRTNSKAVEVKTDMEQLDNQFAGHKMQDANEFLCRFMDELRENIGKMYGENGDTKELEVMDDAGARHNLTNFVDTNFQYEKQEQFVCCSCGHKSQTKYTDVNFFLDLSDTSVTCSVSLQQLVEQTLAPEVREKRCDSCGHETATTTTTLVTLPRVMLLYLKRYKYMGTVGGASLGTGGQTTSRKLTRLVDIPDTVSMEKLVSDNVHVPDPVLSESLDINNHQMETEEVPEPETVSSSQLLPSTPVKNNCDNPVLPLTYEGLGTPIKFKGKTEEDLAKLSEEEQTEYLLYISQKEALTSNGREAVLVNEDEDEDLKAALEASLLDVESPNPKEGAESVNEEKENSFKTPTRKRQHSSTSDVGESPPPNKIARHSGGVFTQNTESLLNRRGATPTPTNSPVSDKAASPDKKVSWKKSFHRPVTKAEEEADMLRALELSTQDVSNDDHESTEENNVSDDQLVPESSDNNDNTVITGPPEFCYKLSSIVSHFGASTTAGHYVADVYR